MMFKTSVDLDYTRRGGRHLVHVKGFLWLELCGVFLFPFDLLFGFDFLTAESWRKGRMTFILISGGLFKSAIAYCGLCLSLSISFWSMSVQHRCLEN